MPIPKTARENSRAQTTPCGRYAPTPLRNFGLRVSQEAQLLIGECERWLVRNRESSAKDEQQLEYPSMDLAVGRAYERDVPCRQAGSRLPLHGHQPGVQLGSLVRPPTPVG